MAIYEFVMVYSSSVRVRRKKMNQKNFSTQIVEKKKQKKSVMGIILSLCCICLIVITCMSLKKIVDQKDAALERLAQAQEQYDQAVMQNRTAQRTQQEMLNSDYLSQIARRDYYYSKEGEIIFDIEETLQDSTTEH